MRALLDVNVLIALLDSEHGFHGRATRWFFDHAEHGWASCPLTQNGCLRVMTQPGYPKASPLSVMENLLGEFTRHPSHEFWPDDISLLDATRVDLGFSHGPSQLTDLYLLALAVHRGGRLVTFDRRIPLRAAVGAEAKHLLVI